MKRVHIYNFCFTFYFWFLSSFLLSFNLSSPRMTQSNHSVVSNYGSKSTTCSRPATSAGRQKQDCLLAIAESRGVATEIGLCFINMHDNTCYISQVSIWVTYIILLSAVCLSVFIDCWYANICEINAYDSYLRPYTSIACFQSCMRWISKLSIEFDIRF